MSHTSRSQESQRKHFQTAPVNEEVLRLLACIASDQVSAAQLVAHVAAGDLRATDLTDKRAAA